MMFAVSIDRHTIALLSIIGTFLDVLGGLYLAYDLLGGEHGPLRTLTRAVTYGTLFGVGYGLALGPVFGVVSGPAHGITLGWEYVRAAKRIAVRLLAGYRDERHSRRRFRFGRGLSVRRPVRHHLWRLEHCRPGHRLSAGHPADPEL